MSKSFCNCPCHQYPEGTIMHIVECCKPYDGNLLKFMRGEADGRHGHPPAEVTEDYLDGYAVGLEKRK